MATIAPVAATELIRSTTFGNAVGTELNKRTIKVTGLTEEGLPMTGSLVINASPGIKLRQSANAPFIQFENTTGATRYSRIIGNATQIVYDLDSVAGTSIHSFRLGNVEHMHIDTAGVDINGALTVSSTAVVSGLVSGNSGGRFGGNGSQVALVDTATTLGTDEHDCYLSYYGAANSMTDLATRTGYVGFNATTALQVRNEVTNGGVLIVANGSGTLALATGASGDITATTGAGGNIILNPDAAVIVNGAISSTTATNTTANLVLQHNTNANGAAFVQFRNAAGGVLSAITQDDVAPVGILINNCHTTDPSDYRLKDDLGPVVAALERVLQLRPRHLAWKETGAEFDGFLAHEVADVVPDAVYGAKDAVYDADEAEAMGVEAGAIKPQGLDQTPLIPLLTAGLQEAIARIEALEDAA